MEFHFYADLHVDGPAIFKSRVELPISHCVNSFLIEAETQPTHNTNVAGMTSGIDNEPQRAGSLFLGPARFLGVIADQARRPQLEQRFRRPPCRPAANATATSRSNSSSMADSHSAARSGADTSTRASSIRRRRGRHDVLRRCAQSRHVILSHVNRGGATTVGCAVSFGAGFRMTIAGGVICCSVAFGG